MCLACVYWIGIYSFFLILWNIEIAIIAYSFDGKSGVSNFFLKKEGSLWDYLLQALHNVSTLPHCYLVRGRIKFPVFLSLALSVASQHLQSATISGHEMHDYVSGEKLLSCTEIGV